jgi:uncharacterized integral membrane protein
VLRRLIAAVVLVPLAVLIIAFAVANRQDVTVSFDPFSADDPAASKTLPLWALVILVLIAGVLIGGVASWLRQGKWRGSARRLERELRHLRDRLSVFEEAAAKPNEPAQPPQRQRLRLPLR